MSHIADHMEPEVENIEDPLDAAQCSIAISLKRIADTLAAIKEDAQRLMEQNRFLERK